MPPAKIPSVSEPFGWRFWRVMFVAVCICCCMHGVLFAQSTGKPQQGDDLFSVSFPNEREGWACGRWGTVLHTADGGTSWARQETGTEYTLTSISFVDVKHGWAVGNEGTIIHTSDGGKTWKKQKSPVPFFLMDVVFVNPAKGWIVTERTHILNTEDGGNTWKVQFKEDDFILKAVSFSDSQNGWVVGEYGYIYHTDNGGRTWQKQAGSFGFSEKTGEPVGENSLFDVVAIDTRTAWAVGMDGHIARTLDGGRNWQPIPSPVPKTQLFSIASDKKDALVVSGNQVLFYSPNGGKTWSKAQAQPPLSYGWLYGIVYQGKGGFVAVGEEGSIYHGNSAVWKKAGFGR